MSADIIEKVIQGLFPPGSSLVDNPNGVGPENRFLVVPGQHGPKWLLPAFAASARAVVNNWRPYGVPSTIKWKFVRFVYVAGLLAKLPQVQTIGIAVPDQSNWAHLGYEPGTQLSPTVYLGSPGITQKAVAFVSVQGTPTGLEVVKVPLGTEAKDPIAREAACLTELGVELADRIPELIHFDPDTGISRQTLLNGEPAPRRLLDCHIEFLAALRRDGTVRLEDFYRQVIEQLSSHRPITQLPIQDIVNREMDASAGLPALPRFRVHGDFAPWNLKMIRPKFTGAVDWEECAAEGPPLLDLINFFWMNRLVFGDAPRSSQIIPDTVRQISFVTDFASPAVLAALERYFILNQFVDVSRTGFEDPNRRLQMDALSKLVSTMI